MVRKAGYTRTSSTFSPDDWESVGLAKRILTASLGVAFLVASTMTGAAQSAKGNAPANALPPALLAQHALEQICQPLDELVHGEDWEIHHLTEDFVLYMVPCAAGAYNFSYSFYVGTAGQESYARLLFVNYYGPYGWTGVDQLFNPFFDETTLTLTSFYKGRGLADCGTSGVWRWDQYAFALEAFYAQDECDGTIEPGDFPQVWPAQ